MPLLSVGNTLCSRPSTMLSSAAPTRPSFASLPPSPLLPLLLNEEDDLSDVDEENRPTIEPSADVTVDDDATTTDSAELAVKS